MEHPLRLLLDGHCHFDHMVLIKLTTHFIDFFIFCPSGANVGGHEYPLYVFVRKAVVCLQIHKNESLDKIF